MKRGTFLLGSLVLFILTMAIMSSQVQAQSQNFVDIRPARYLTDSFVEAFLNKNIKVNATFKCGTNYRADWVNGAYVRLTGKAYIWTDQQGIVHIHLFTADPPMALNGLRPPMTLNTANFNMDGTIVQGDEDYWLHYMRWRDRPCVDFRMSLLTQRGLVDAWRYFLQGKPVHKFVHIWEALGLDGQTAMPPEFLNMSAVLLPVDELPDEPTPEWAGKLNLPPMVVEPGGTFETIDQPTGFIGFLLALNPIIQLIGALIVGVGCLYVGVRVLR